MSCSVCKSKLYARGLCNAHYKKLLIYGDPNGGTKPRGSLRERFEPKVDKGQQYNGCWAWAGAKSSNGYGVIQEAGRGSRNLSAHRVAYELARGPIAGGLLVLHSCDNHWCVNPEHLRVGTQSENIREAFAKKRKTSPVKSGEQNPRSKLTVRQVEFIKAHPELKHTELAKLFGLSPNCIRGVRIGRTWN